VALAAEFGLAGTRRLRGCEGETRKSESQSALGEEWEAHKRKKQQIRGIIRGTETKSAR